MKNALDLDSLRGKWHALDTRLDATLELDIASLRRSLSDRVISAFRRHSRWLLASLIFDAVAVGCLIAFAISFSSELPYLLCAIALLLGLSPHVASDVNEWIQLRRLDFDAPVIEVRKHIARLRNRRLRATGMILLLSIGLWTPFMLVVVRAAFGIDLYNLLPWSVTAVNVALGITVIPAGYWASQRFAKRFAGSQGFDQFINDAAGRSWSQASSEWNAYADLRSESDAGASLNAVKSQRHREAVNSAIAEPMRALKWRARIGIAIALLPILLLPFFNMAHGGMPIFIISGVSLHLVCVAVMIANIVHSGALSRLDTNAPRETIAAALDWMATQRERFARLLVVVAPILALPTSIVVARWAFNIDLSLIFPISAKIVIAIIAVGATSTLARMAKHQGSLFASGLVEWLCLGVRRSTNAVIHALPRDLPQHD